MKVLVIYELIPEETNKAIVEMTQEEYEYFKQVNSIIVDFDDIPKTQEEILNVIDSAFCTNSESSHYYGTEKEKQYFCKWENTEVIEDISDVDKFIWCGFYL